jgi:RNA polymerase sigma-70 factor (ECF subfamily)
MMVDASQQSVDEFLVAIRPLLERALVARHGVPRGVDAASDAIEYAIRHWPRVSHMDNPAGYLFRVGDSRANRSRRRRERTTLLVGEPTTVDIPVDIDLQRALMLLSWEQRVAIVLVYAHGHSYSDAARLMDLPVTAVTNHLSRGMRRLRTRLEQQ